MTPAKNSQRLNWWILVVLGLLLGAALRLNGIQEMSRTLLYDEAFYAVDALSLLAEPRFQPFFDNNYGREGLWMAIIAPAMLLMGPEIFTLRVVTAWMGILTLAAAYRVGRELIGPRGGLWTMFALGVLYWHAHLSHITFRAILYPLIGALALAWLLRAARLNRGWLSLGLFTGLLAYTYLAARGWILAIVAVMGLLFLLRPAQRRGIVKALLLAGLIALPLVIYAIQYPESFNQRTNDLTLGGVDEVIRNALDWTRVWLIEGENYIVNNLPGRPVLDLPLAFLTLLGIISLLRKVSWPWLLLIAALFFGSLAPSILSFGNTNMLRAFGVVIPLAICIGAGALLLEEFIRRYASRSAATVGICLMFGLAGWNSYRDIGTMATLFPQIASQETRILASIERLVELQAPASRVYFMPLQYTYPLIPFRDWKLRNYQIGSFDPGYCTIFSQNQRVLYVSVPVEGGPNFETSMAFHEQSIDEWANLTKLYDGEYTIFAAEADARLSEGWEDALIFDDTFAVQILRAPDPVQRNGDWLALTLAIRTLKPVDADYNIFLHLYGDPSPYEGGRLWGNDDARICEANPPFRWRSDEVIVQTQAVFMPGDAPDGFYELALGIVESATGERLATGQANDVWPILSVENVNQ